MTASWGEGHTSDQRPELVLTEGGWLPWGTARQPGRQAVGWGPGSPEARETGKGWKGVAGLVLGVCSDGVPAVPDLGWRGTMETLATIRVGRQSLLSEHD